jgi:ribose transport system ATP-binding protein
VRAEDVIAAAKPEVLATSAVDAVSVRDVSKSFGEAHALRRCSFAARGGEVHAIVGENGSGKSTLAKLLAGVLYPDSGVIQVNGETPTDPHAAREMGITVVFQEILVVDGATVLDNLFVGDDGLFRARLSQREKRIRAHGMLGRLVGAPVDLDAIVDELPLNTRQWIVISRALLGKPRVVVFDESTAALDHSSVERFFDVVRQLRAEGACVLIVTHRIHELTAICDRVTVLSDGTDVGTLTKSEITEARLLELMRRGGASSQGPIPVPAAPLARAALELGEAALVVSGLRLADAAAPIDLTLRAGEIVGLAGLEGHGQVEFIEAVTGFRAPAAGTVHVIRDGVRHLIESAKAADRAGMVYIPGDRKKEGLFSNLSVFENFGIACYRRTSLAGFIDRRRVGRMFDQQVADLSIRLSQAGAPINSLSGGNQQKLVIGRSLATLPRVIALNDPTRGIDIAAKADLYALLRSHAAQGKAILFLSNEIEEFEGLCDRVAVFRGQALFGVLAGDSATSDSVLAAMFGYSDVRALDRAVQ